MLYLSFINRSSVNNKFVYDIKKYMKKFDRIAQEKNKMDYDLKDLKVTYDGIPVDMSEFGVK